MNYRLAACLLVASYIVKSVLDALLRSSVFNERFFLGARGGRGEEGLGIGTRLKENTEKRNAMFGKFQKIFIPNFRFEIHSSVHPRRLLVKL